MFREPTFDVQHVHLVFLGLLLVFIYCPYKEVEHSGVSPRRSYHFVGIRLTPENATTNYPPNNVCASRRALSTNIATHVSALHFPTTRNLPFLACVAAAFGLRNPRRAQGQRHLRLRNNFGEQQATLVWVR